MLSEAQINVATSCFEPARIRVNGANDRKQDSDDNTCSSSNERTSFNRIERMKAPPPPTIRPRSPESPPLKRYKLHLFQIQWNPDLNFRPKSK